jgi:predicted MFS family arabinose efflux permease
VLRALLLLPLLAVGSADLLWLLFLVRGATGTVGLFFTPAENALLPRLVGEERLVTANALNALNNNLGRLVGPAIGGVLYAWGGLGTVVVVDAVSFLGSAALVGAIRAGGRPEVAGRGGDGVSAWGRVVGEWGEGLRLVGRDRALRTIFGAMLLGFVGEGTFAVGFAPLAVDVLEGGATGAGLLMSAQAVGGLLAGVAVARVALRVAPRWLFVGGMVGLGLADLGMVNAANLAPAGAVAVGVAMGFMFLAGFPVVAQQAAGNGLLQALTADAFRGRVFGALGAVEGVAILVGLGLGGPAVDAVGIVPVMSVGASMWFVGAAVAVARLPADVGRAKGTRR